MCCRISTIASKKWSLENGVVRQHYKDLAEKDTTKTFKEEIDCLVQKNLPSTIANTQKHISEKYPYQLYFEYSMYSTFCDFFLIIYYLAKPN